MDTIGRFVGAVQRSVNRADFRRNPIKALVKRIWWKLRWKLSHRLWLLTLNNDIKVLVPNSGSGALIYYLGQTEPETAGFFSRYIRPGMIVFDIGAHLGEYTLRAAHLTGSQGRVYAFEPNPDLCDCIQQNVALNGLENVAVITAAVADQNHDLQFEIAAEPAVSALSSELASPLHKVARTIRVNAVTLDSFWESLDKPRIDLIKIDVEGAEGVAFKGAAGVLDQPPENAPTLLFEFSQVNYAIFGFTREDVLSSLAQYGYRFFELAEGGTPHPVQETVLLENPVSRNVLATKNAHDLLAVMGR